MLSRYRTGAIIRMKQIIEASTVLIIAGGLLMTLSRCSTRQGDESTAFMGSFGLYRLIPLLFR